VNEPGPGDGSPGTPCAGQPDPGTAPETLAALSALYREHSRWAIWPPQTPFGPWTAVRIAGSRAPAAGLPLLWATAATSIELDAEMRRADGALRPDWGTPGA
jgi:hypothetical protein